MGVIEQVSSVLMHNEKTGAYFLIDEPSELATQINSIDYWDNDLNLQFVRLAGLEEEYITADDFEKVIYEAADILGVEID